jgi:hypothetical protein
VYSLTEDNKTVLRAGYGVFYSVENGGLGTSLASNFPFTNIQEFNGNTGYNLSTGIEWPPPADPANPRGQVKWHNPDNRTPYVQQWNITLEREMIPDLLLSLRRHPRPPWAPCNINMPPLTDGVVGSYPYPNVGSGATVYA